MSPGAHLCVGLSVLALLSGPAGAAGPDVVFADFERGVPFSSRGGTGFRSQDAAVLVESWEGAAGTARSLRLVLGPNRRSVFLQGPVRRRYLLNGSPVYEPGRVNALTFYLRVPRGSPLIRTQPRKTFGVWSYHWRPGDVKVGGESNKGLATDSMMHGYASLSLKPGAEERWLRIVLSPSAFQQQRNYFHWYAAQGVTGSYDLFATLRQLQFKYLGPPKGVVELQLDELGFATLPETARAEPGFASEEVRAGAGPVRVPLVLSNPTSRDRRYRFFVSSELGVSREVMHQAIWRHDDLYGARAVQQAVGGDGGLGAAWLEDGDGERVGFEEIAVPAGGRWTGALVHGVSRKMLGPWKEVDLHGEATLVRRDTLTTSVIFWDPAEPPPGDMEWVRSAGSNADDGSHRGPPGFPKQVRPPPGWRSEDVPMGQVGGYGVTEITLRP